MEHIFRTILIIVEVLSCLLLIGVILLQQSKSGGGLGMAFGGGMSESLFGSRAGNVLTKITIILSVIFLANTTLLGIMYTSSDERSLVEKSGVNAPVPVAPLAPQANDMMSPSPQPQPTMLPTPVDQPTTVLTPDVMDSPTVDFDVAPVAVEDVETAVDMPVDVPESVESTEPVTP